ncbi:MAG: sensor histidine kinase [Caulobacteraceae bacterium]
MRGAKGLDRLTSAGIPAAVGLLVFVVCYASIALTRHGHTIAPFWPGTSIALCAMLRWARSTSKRIVLSLVAAAAIWGANFCSGAAGWLPVAFSGFNVLELGLATVIAERWAPKSFATPVAGWAFLLKVGMIPPALGASLAVLATLLAGRGDPAAAGEHWYMGHLLGFVLVGPFAMTISKRAVARLELRARSVEAAAVCVFVLISAIVVFGQDRMPLLFLTLPSMLLATFRFRLVGAGIAALLVALVASPLTAMGLGPIALTPPELASVRIFVLQIFLATSSLICIPVASALNDRDRKGALVEAQRREALQASQAKSELLAHVSHDVRSPLTAIIGFAGLLKHGQASPEQTARFAALIIKNAEFLKALSDDLLDIAQVEAGALTIRRERVDLGELLEQLESTFSGDRGALQIQAVALGALVVQADAHRLVQVLNNLTSNALKYGGDYGPVTVEAQALDAGAARICVSNRGPGIPDDRRAELFKPFSRLGAENGKIAGTGLGLSITKQLVELQGGRIDMSSVPDEETRFWVDLPLAPADVSARAQSSQIDGPVRSAA